MHRQVKNLIGGSGHEDPGFTACHVCSQRSLGGDMREGRWPETFAAQMPCISLLATEPVFE